MKIPEFKPSRRFLGMYDVPCLVAEIKNSEVGLASETVARFKRDPLFKIYLRARDHENISPWQRQKLELLFEKDGLPAALAEGLRDSYYGEAVRAEDRPFYEKHGYSPYFHVLKLVIDDIRRRVFIVVDDEFHVLSEHLGTIYLKARHWHFEELDYCLRYEDSFEQYRIPEDTSAADEACRQFEEKWDALFPPPVNNQHFESDAPALYGVWNANKQATAELLKKLGEIDDLGVVMSGKASWWFSPAAIDELALGYTVSSLFVSGCQRRGNWISLQVANQAGETPWTQNYWCDGTQLVEYRGRRVYTRGSDGFRKGISMAELFKRKS